jgi:hypothetical protein
VDPPRQHFETDDLAGLEVHLGLEKGHELVVIEPIANTLFDFALGDQFALHAAIEPYRAGGTAAFGMFHGNVGAAQQVRNPQVGRGGGGDAGKRSDLDQPIVNREGRGDSVQDGFRRLFKGLGSVRIERDRDGEFITAQAGDLDLGFERLDHRRGDRAQQAVTHFITVPVVDRLEPVDLDRDDGQLMTGQAGPLGQCLGPVGKALAIEQAGVGIG